MYPMWCAGSSYIYCRRAIFSWYHCILYCGHRLHVVITYFNQPLVLYLLLIIILIKNIKLAFIVQYAMGGVYKCMWWNQRYKKCHWFAIIIVITRMSCFFCRVCILIKNDLIDNLIYKIPKYVKLFDEFNY